MESPKAASSTPLPGSTHDDPNASHAPTSKDILSRAKKMGLFDTIRHDFFQKWSTSASHDIFVAECKTTIDRIANSSTNHREDNVSVRMLTAIENSYAYQKLKQEIISTEFLASHETKRRISEGLRDALTLHLSDNRDPTEKKPSSQQHSHQPTTTRMNRFATTLNNALHNVNKDAVVDGGSSARKKRGESVVSTADDMELESDGGEGKILYLKPSIDQQSSTTVAPAIGGGIEDGAAKKQKKKVMPKKPTSSNPIPSPATASGKKPSKPSTDDATNNSDLSLPPIVNVSRSKTGQFLSTKPRINIESVDASGSSTATTPTEQQSASVSAALTAAENKLERPRPQRHTKLPRRFRLQSSEDELPTTPSTPVPLPPVAFHPVTAPKTRAEKEADEQQVDSSTVPIRGPKRARPVVKDAKPVAHPYMPNMAGRRLRSRVILDDEEEEGSVAAAVKKPAKKKQKTASGSDTKKNDSNNNENIGEEDATSQLFQPWDGISNSSLTDIEDSDVESSSGDEDDDEPEGEKGVKEEQDADKSFSEIINVDTLKELLAQRRREAAGEGSSGNSLASPPKASSSGGSNTAITSPKGIRTLLPEGGEPNYNNNSNDNNGDDDMDVDTTDSSDLSEVSSDEDDEGPIRRVTRSLAAGKVVPLDAVRQLPPLDTRRPSSSGSNSRGGSAKRGGRNSPMSATSPPLRRIRQLLPEGEKEEKEKMSPLPQQPVPVKKEERGGGEEVVQAVGGGGNAQPVVDTQAEVTGGSEQPVADTLAMDTQTQGTDVAQVTDVVDTQARAIDVDVADEATAHSKTISHNHVDESDSDSSSESSGLSDVDMDDE
ncbi:hypothetical protein SmJEL517_g05773 [Synchytrium microbalum]|uniref:Uncharacterized protein n=1 Tax=Synchytrium microbalum TaxID=1806994 RepID=A0A507BZD9_9FUNG|nr:uncharacterized protein SmJEL517_g05773 [Synchytrium microbalum]TPX30725.1 hypothetical protein SmJEL517_g05773 [Synchytrium microbalum]